MADDASIPDVAPAGPADVAQVDPSRSEDYGYRPERLPAMLDLSQRQRAKDELFVRDLVRCLRPGSVLEIGAGCGQLSGLLSEAGWDVTASDVQPFLVGYMRSVGLRAIVLDVMELSSSLDRPFDNIVAQSISTLITRDLDTVRSTYRSVHRAMAPGTMFIFVLPAPWRGDSWSTTADHLRIAQEEGFDLVHRFRHQVLSSRMYGRLPAQVSLALDHTLGRLIGVRQVFVFTPRSLTV